VSRSTAAIGIGAELAPAPAAVRVRERAEWRLCTGLSAAILSWTNDRLKRGGIVSAGREEAEMTMNSQAARLPRLIAGFGCALLLSAGAAAAQQCPPPLNHTFPRLQDEKPQNLCQFRGQVLLVVNTASYCGYTPQYEGLEKLHATYGTRGFTVLGFPSGDFGNQEKANNKEIAEFCFNTYGVKFPMFAKSSVVGQTANPFFAELTKATGQPPKWNFHKYLIDREGRVVAAFPSNVAPLDKRVTGRIEELLAR
jgi:glutathione peroxidase